MNAATERCGFAANSAPPSISDCLINEPRVWVEMLDADDRPTAALQVSGLPLALRASARACTTAAASASVLPGAGE